jgi:hypothetical protein
MSRIGCKLASGDAKTTRGWPVRGRQDWGEKAGLHLSLRSVLSSRSPSGLNRARELEFVANTTSPAIVTAVTVW